MLVTSRTGTDAQKARVPSRSPNIPRTVVSLYVQANSQQRKRSTDHHVHAKQLTVTLVIERQCINLKGLGYPSKRIGMAKTPHILLVPDPDYTEKERQI
jgi:hypothetical protein